MLLLIPHCTGELCGTLGSSLATLLTMKHVCNGQFGESFYYSPFPAKCVCLQPAWACSSLLACLTAFENVCHSLTSQQILWQITTVAKCVEWDQVIRQHLSSKVRNLCFIKNQMCRRNQENQSVWDRSVLFLRWCLSAFNDELVTVIATTMSQQLKASLRLAVCECSRICERGCNIYMVLSCQTPSLGLQYFAQRPPVPPQTFSTLRLRGALPHTGLILSLHLPFLPSPAKICNARMNMHQSKHRHTYTHEIHTEIHRAVQTEHGKRNWINLYFYL